MTGEKRSDEGRAKEDTVRKTLPIITVLVVDDEAVPRRLAERMIARNKPAIINLILKKGVEAELKILTAKNAFDALIELGSARVDFMLTDNNMPPYNGTEMTGEWRRREVTHPAYRDNPCLIVGMSGAKTVVDASGIENQLAESGSLAEKAFLANGANAFIDKADLFPGSGVLTPQASNTLLPALEKAYGNKSEFDRELRIRFPATATSEMAGAGMSTSDSLDLPQALAAEGIGGASAVTQLRKSGNITRQSLRVERLLYSGPLDVDGIASPGHGTLASASRQSHSATSSPTRLTRYNANRIGTGSESSLLVSGIIAGSAGFRSYRPLRAASSSPLAPLANDEPNSTSSILTAGAAPFVAGAGATDARRLARTIDRQTLASLTPTGTDVPTHFTTIEKGDRALGYTQVYPIDFVSEPYPLTRENHDGEPSSTGGSVGNAASLIFAVTPSQAYNVTDARKETASDGTLDSSTSTAVGAEEEKTLPQAPQVYTDLVNRVPPTEAWTVRSHSDPSKRKCCNIL